jgi:hypothetical protein
MGGNKLLMRLEPRNTMRYEGGNMNRKRNILCKIGIHKYVIVASGYPQYSVK